MRLTAAGVVFSVRRAVLRFSCFIHNNEADVDQALEVVRQWRRDFPARRLSESPVAYPRRLPLVRACRWTGALKWRLPNRAALSARFPYRRRRT